MNRSLIIYTFLFSLILTHSARASIDYPNDSGTGISVKGKDCGTIDILDGFFTYYGDHSHSAKGLILKIKIDNVDYVKKVKTILNNINEASATNSNDWWQYPSTISYDYQINNVDYATLLDQRTGPENFINLSLSVEMNGKTYHCSNIVIE